jgi:hypothetical protein
MRCPRRDRHAIAALQRVFAGRKCKNGVSIEDISGLVRLIMTVRNDLALHGYLHQAHAGQR